MELRHMRYFLALADELDSTRAAKLCGLTPSVLGRHISDLEESLGCSLFRRRGMQVSLSAAGLVFYRRAKELLASAAAAAGEVRAAAAAVASEIRFAHYGEWWKKRYASGLQCFSGQNAGVRLRSSLYEPSAARQALLGGEVDVALLESVDLALRIDFNIRRLELLPAVVALPAKHSHAAKRPVSFTSLREEVWVVWDERIFPGRRHLLLEAARKAHFLPCIAWEAESEQTVFQQVAAGNAIGYLPSGVHGKPPAGVVVAPLKPAAIAFPVFVAWRKDADHIEQLESFAQSLLGCKI